MTDYASNHLIGYGVTSGSTLNFLISGPFKTGSEPSAIVIDPRAKYIYISNSLDSSVSPYTIDLATGIPSTVVNVTGSQINATDSEPVAIAVDPALGRFVYTANYLGNSISGFQLNPDSGALEADPGDAISSPVPSHGTGDRSARQPLAGIHQSVGRRSGFFRKCPAEWLGFLFFKSEIGNDSRPRC